MGFLIRLVAWAVGSCLVAEFLGYFLHRLLHSDRIHILSRTHMQHHLLLYGPLGEQRPEPEYISATRDRPSLGSVGLEWIIPSGILLFVCILALNLLHVRIVFQLTFVFFVLAWSFFTFSYVHDGMHVRNFWMARNPLLRRWFLKARQRHDLHHQVINDEGLMNMNFGLGLSLFDRLFGTHFSDEKPFNGRGYHAAFRRYSFLSSGAFKNGGRS